MLKQLLFVIALVASTSFAQTPLKIPAVYTTDISFTVSSPKSKFVGTQTGSTVAVYSKGKYTTGPQTFKLTSLSFFANDTTYSLVEGFRCTSTKPKPAIHDISFMNSYAKSLDSPCRPFLNIVGNKWNVPVANNDTYIICASKDGLTPYSVDSTVGNVTTTMTFMRFVPKVLNPKLLNLDKKCYGV